MANIGSVTTNFFPIANETYSNNINTTIGAGAATVFVNSASLYTDGDVVVLTVDPSTSAQATFTGVKASAPDRFTNCFWTEGNVGVGHATGATITDYDSATHNNIQSKGMLVEHTQAGTHKNVTATSVTTTGAITAGTDVVDNGVNSRTFRTQAFSNFIQSGGIWSQVSGLNGTMTALAGYINGYGISLVAIPTRAFTASKDTYVDILMTGATPSLVYTEVANAAASPALAANSLRLAKVVTNGSTITSITQNGGDSLNNLIYPSKPIAPVVYSASETLTGNVWVDGRPIYRKVLRGQITIVIGTALFAHSISGLTSQWEIVSFSGGLKFSAASNSGGQIVFMAYRETGGNWVHIDAINQTDIVVTASYAWGNSYFEAVMEYVK